MRARSITNERLLVGFLLVACHGGDDARGGDAGLGTTGGIDVGGEDDGGTSGGADEVGTSAADDGGPAEICDGFDNDANGEVDESCACMPGDTQTCFAGPAESFIECRGTTQACEGAPGSESIWTWGACTRLCEGSTLAFADDAGTRIWGAAANDGFALVGRAPLGDIDGDGELDMLAVSSAGDATLPDVGASYVLYGGPCMQGATLDLATLTLDGSIDEALHGGFVIERSSAAVAAFAQAGDVDGDGRQDVTLADSSNSAAIVFGADAPAPLYSTTSADGVTAGRLQGGGGSNGMWGGIATGDLDGDGWADVAMSANNSTVPSPTCPCSPNGVALWWGRAAFGADTPRDLMIDIGIGTVGVATQSNFSVVGGYGDFDNDGALDLVVGAGAANDGYLVPYRTAVWRGGPSRTLPASVLGVDGTNGFVLAGGPGSGPFPNHQHGDFDGDGIDDVVAYGYVPYQTGASIYVVYGHAGAFPAQLDAAALGDAGTTIVAASLLGFGDTMGAGDLDGDGFDDLAIPISAEPGGVAIVWGRADAGTMLDVETDPTTLVLDGTIELGFIERIAIADLDGDGLGDLVAGAPSATTPNGERSGAGIVKYGACLAAHHNPELVRGGDGNDELTGTVAADRVAAGRGDDTIDGAGGGDVLAAGQGDDRVRVPDDAFVRIHGGLGEDTLVLDGNGLDLRAIGRARVQEIERFELGDGAQTLAFGTGDLSALSSSTRTFVVEGDADDALILDGDWDAEGDPDGDGRVAYTHGALTVLVSSAVEVVA